MLTVEQIEANARTYQEQAFKVLDDDPARLELRRNSEWLDMGMSELLALVRTTTVGQLLERDDFAKRRARGEPVSMLELLYPLMQGYDSVAVRADVELGGTDQTFNLLLGRDIQRAYGQAEQAVLTMPLLVGIDGREKMSKSLGNQIGVDRRRRARSTGARCRSPTALLEQWYQLLLGRACSSRRRPARGQARAGARADRDLPRRRRPPTARPPNGTASSVERGAAERDRGGDVHARTNGTVHLPALIAEIFGALALARRAG